MKVDLSFEIDAEAVIAIAEAAGDVILEVYNSPTYAWREKWHPRARRPCVLLSRIKPTFGVTRSMRRR